MFTECLKSLADDITEKQFEVFVQQQFKIYENIFLKPKILSKELRLCLIESLHQPLYEKNKRLRSINYADFQRFCREYCNQVQIKAVMQGNLTEEQALNHMNGILNKLNCGKIEDVSPIRFYNSSMNSFNLYQENIFIHFLRNH